MPTTHTETSWFPRRVDDANVAMRLLCFPHAGGASATFHRLRNHVDPEIELLPVRLPGREGRFHEKPFDSLEELLQALAPQVHDIVSEPYALLGHSAGAYVAFELARLLRRQAFRPPEYLFVVAARAPQLAPETPFLHTLPDDDLLLQAQQRYGEMPAGSYDRLIRLLLPTLRADLMMVESYQYQDDEPLDCPIMAIGGRDDHAVQRADMAAWRAQTSIRFSQRTVGGGHFLFSESGPQIMQRIGKKLSLSLCDKSKHD